MQFMKSLLEIQIFVYENQLDKACFQHDMAYSKTNDLTKRTQSR